MYGMSVLYALSVWLGYSGKPKPADDAAEPKAEAEPESKETLDSEDAYEYIEVTPTPEPTVEPTPTPEPTAEPTPEPTPTPTPTPTPEIIITPEPAPTQEPEVTSNPETPDNSGETLNPDGQNA